MNTNTCSREREVVRAFRLNLWPPELVEHVSQCAACTEARTVSGALLQQSVLLSEQSFPPHATHVWKRAQAQRKAIASRRALLPLFVVTAMSLAYGTVLLGWLLREFWNNSARRVITAFSVWMNASVVAGVVLTVVLIAFGAWYMLRSLVEPLGSVRSPQT